MPIDLPKCRSLIAAGDAHRMHPGGEMITAMTDQLREAVKDMNGSNDAIRNAQLAAQAAERALADEREAGKDYRQNTVRFQAVIEVMRQIAAGAKAPKKLALETLQKNGFEVVPPAVEEPK